MADNLLTLRERLRQSDADLSADLDLQWRIAMTEWLPAVPPNLDSSNSLPHIRNIESHLDEVLRAVYRYDSSASVLQMRPIEIYLLLASMLFHDLGRTDDSNGDHGLKSREHLEMHYGSLGIRNREIARSLGGICASHTAKPEERMNVERKLSLGDIVIDPYGQVRQRMIAALLTLGDHMDCAQTRVVPDYLRIKKDVVGSFRSGVQGVFADPAARLVRTVLAPLHLDKEQKKIEIKFKLSKEDLNEWIRKFNKALGLENDVFSKLRKSISKEGLERKNVNKLINGQPGDFITFLKSCFGRIDGAPLDFTERLVAWNILQASSKSRDWPPKTLVAIVLGDLRKNRTALYSIRDHLAAVGLPLATWLIDYEERLFTPNWKETYEPLFHEDYLIEVAEAMWDLSRRVVGTSEFTYLELASHIGDHEISRVRMAARRLAIVTTAMEPEPSLLSPIWAGNERWKWRVNACDMVQGSGCKFFSIKNVKARIKNLPGLSEPDDPQEHGGFL